MKQKIDPYMLSEIPKSKLSFYFTVILIGVAIWFLIFLSPEYCDDFAYKFVFMRNMPDGFPVDINHPVRNFIDIIISQYNHYFQWNGRTVTHIIVQFFTGIAGKNVFNIINSFIFILFLIFILIYTNYKLNGLNILFAAGLTFFLFPVLGQTVFWMTGSINYLWTCTFICLLLILIKKTTFIKYRNIDSLFFIPSLLIGWTHEGITVPVAGSLLIYTIINWRTLKNSFSLILIIGFFIGAILCGLSPATINRTSSIELPFIELCFNRCQSFFVVLSKLKAFFVLIIGIIINCIIGKHSFYKFYKENLIECNSIIFSLVIVFISGFWILRVAAGVEFFSIILILKILKFKYINYLKYAVSLSFIILFSIILRYSTINYEIHKNILTQLDNKDCNYIKYDNLNIGSWLSSFIVFHNLQVQIDPEQMYNKLMSRIYSHDNLFFIPKSIFETLVLYNGHTIPLDQQSDFPFYIFPFETTDKSNLRIFYILRPVKEDEIPFYLKPFASKLQRYTACEIESPSNEYYIIQIERKFYLVIMKNYMIDNRVIDIKIT